MALVSATVFHRSRLQAFSFAGFIAGWQGYGLLRNPLGVSIDLAQPAGVAVAVLISMTKSGVLTCCGTVRKDAMSGEPG